MPVGCSLMVLFCPSCVEGIVNFYQYVKQPEIDPRHIAKFQYGIDIYSPDFDLEEFKRLYLKDKR